MNDNQYYRQLDWNPSISIGFFSDWISMIRAGHASGSMIFDFQGQTMKAEFDSASMQMLFMWHDGHRNVTQAIEVVRMQSNLYEDKCFYLFKHPYCWKMSRTLYLIGDTFLPRELFAYHYYSQHRSHLERTVYYQPDPSRAYGKKFYRGMLTPYGRRCDKYDEHNRLVERHLEKKMYKLCAI